MAPQGGRGGGWIPGGAPPLASGGSALSEDPQGRWGGGRAGSRLERGSVLGAPGFPGSPQISPSPEEASSRGLEEEVVAPRRSQLCARRPGSGRGSRGRVTWAPERGQRQQQPERRRPARGRHGPRRAGARGALLRSRARPGPRLPGATGGLRRGCGHGSSRAQAAGAGGASGAAPGAEESGVQAQRPAPSPAALRLARVAWPRPPPPPPPRPSARPIPASPPPPRQLPAAPEPGRE